MISQPDIIAHVDRAFSPALPLTEAEALRDVFGALGDEAARRVFLQNLDLDDCVFDRRADVRTENGTLVKNVELVAAPETGNHLKYLCINGLHKISNEGKVVVLRISIVVRRVRDYPEQSGRENT